MRGSFELDRVGGIQVVMKQVGGDLLEFFVGKDVDLCGRLLMPP